LIRVPVEEEAPEKEKTRSRKDKRDEGAVIMDDDSGSGEPHSEAKG
jgi:hypothetical protein